MDTTVCLSLFLFLSFFLSLSLLNDPPPLSLMGISADNFDSTRFLTSGHCLSDQDTAATVEFLFNYSISCEQGVTGFSFFLFSWVFVVCLTLNLLFLPLTSLGNCYSSNPPTVEEHPPLSYNYDCAFQTSGADILVFLPPFFLSFFPSFLSSFPFFLFLFVLLFCCFLFLTPPPPSPGRSHQKTLNLLSFKTQPTCGSLMEISPSCPSQVISLPRGVTLVTPQSIMLNHLEKSFIVSATQWVPPRVSFPPFFFLCHSLFLCGVDPFSFLIILLITSHL